MELQLYWSSTTWILYLSLCLLTQAGYLPYYTININDQVLRESLKL